MFRGIRFVRTGGLATTDKSRQRAGQAEGDGGVKSAVEKGGAASQRGGADGDRSLREPEPEIEERRHGLQHQIRTARAVYEVS